MVVINKPFHLIPTHQFHKNRVNMLKYFLLIVTIWFEFSYASEACGNPNTPLYLEEKKDMPMCPADIGQAKEKLEKLSEYHYEMKYCLWKKKFRSNEKQLCQSEAMPVLRKYQNSEKKPISCGENKNHFLHHFGYYYCGDEARLEKVLKTDYPKDKNYVVEIPGSKVIVGYVLCFDVSENKAVWIQHSIETPDLFEDSSNIEQYCEKDIFKDPFYMNKNVFKNLETRYNSAKKKSLFSNIVMLPQPLAPEDHFTVRAGKKVTNHYINRAPLWDKLVPLMTAIDQGIKRAILNATSKMRTLAQNFLIFNKIKTVHTMMTSIKKWFKIVPFEPNIWKKFIYDPQFKAGVAIYIHNTPGTPVVKKCPTDNITCNFKEWTKDERIRKEISENDLQYAYCCKISTEEAVKEFSFTDFNVQSTFDIDFYSGF